MREWACEKLGVDLQATAAQIKKAYRRKAMAAHPDRAKPEDKEAATAEFKEIQEAYSILSRGAPS
ncbi:MAG: DnaJ domain-containing protein [Betaproteobacteria bacterium AqS2]|uniref:DnaJ domain-containing protein n=1 Tax=Candidatus Amphirhobacter heronislandensis TaxID=1732024 RepID=A0A930UIC8_9GAMM|nr:DnaJ domain-containing protein [Betaproteobacteria bacterium AqS2]MBF2735636.1 DnaJ domain-containing protein [Betaproteobacteria bacterium AqS2]